MTKTQQISAAILSHIQNGKTAQEAVDAVFGPGAYAKIAGEIYDELRAR